MDEFDPDWVGCPKISTLKKMAFQAQRDINDLRSADHYEKEHRTRKNEEHDVTINALLYTVEKLQKENSISNLYFKGLIDKEEAKRLWDLYKSPDIENHKIADLAINSLNNEEIQGSFSATS